MISKIKMNSIPVGIINKVNPYASMMEKLLETGKTGNPKMDYDLALKERLVSMKQL